MNIKEVVTKRDLKSFIRMPCELFGNEPLYVPPIWMFEKNEYSKSHNPILKNSDYILFLLFDDEEKPAGRIIAYIDHRYNEYYKEKTGFYGCFECIMDDAAASLLIKAAEKWLFENDMDKIRGPINPVAENWGFLYQDDGSMPVYMSPWNPKYYLKFFENNGYSKAKDLYAYMADQAAGYMLPDRYENFHKRFFDRFSSVRVREIDKRNLKKDALGIWEISNTALSQNWGYVPLELNVMEDMIKKLELIIDKDAVLIAEVNGKAIGFCLGYPDINGIIKKINGKLLPLGWLVLLLQKRRIRRYRLFGLAIDPKWQNRGLDSILYIELYNRFIKKKILMEANYILEDNYHIKNALIKLGMRHNKTYRIYEKVLSQENESYEKTEIED